MSDVASYRMLYDESLEKIIFKKLQQGFFASGLEKSLTALEAGRQAGMSLLYFYETGIFATCKDFSIFLTGFLASLNAVSARAKLAEKTIEQVEKNCALLGLSIEKSIINNAFKKQSFENDRIALTALLQAYFKDGKIHGKPVLQCGIDNFASLCFVLIEKYDLAKLKENTYQQILQRARFPKDEKEFLRQTSNARRSAINLLSILKDALLLLRDACTIDYTDEFYQVPAPGNEQSILNKIKLLDEKKITRKQIEDLAVSFINNFNGRTSDSKDLARKKGCNEFTFFCHFPHIAAVVNELRKLIPAEAQVAHEEKKEQGCNPEAEELNLRMTR